LCSQYEVHLIADEIAVGMGRTGTMFACEQAPPPQPLPREERGLTPHFEKTCPELAEAGGPGGISGITPDFLLLSKGITGGYLPLSIVMTTENIYQAFYADSTARGFLHSHSYTGNPLACRAALATLDIFAQDDVLNTNRIKTAFFNRIAQPLREHPKVKHFRNTGMIWAFEVVTPHADFAQRCFSLGLQHELLLRPMGNTVYFMPPYIITEEEMQMLVERTLTVIESLT
jgi:adenosylmethionine-8-amino-7-oxononanoate aminotransferase